MSGDFCTVQFLSDDERSAGRSIKKHFIFLKNRFSFREAFDVEKRDGKKWKIWIPRDPSILIFSSA